MIYLILIIILLYIGFLMNAYHIKKLKEEVNKLYLEIHHLKYPLGE